jgi:hypothetical protein
MSQFQALVRTGQSLVISLLIDPRIQAALGLALALATGLLLGPEGAEAGMGINNGGRGGR